METLISITLTQITKYNYQEWFTQEEYEFLLNKKVFKVDNYST